MNNLFHAFSIKVPGQLLDDKLFYEYDDYDVDADAVPADADTVTKGKAFIRMQQIKRKLSELVVPVYCNISFTTPGTMSAVPTDCEIDVGYITLEPFLSTMSTAPTDPTADAAAVLQQIMIDALGEDIVGHAVWVQKTVTRPKAAIPNSPTEKFYELFTDYLTADKETVAVEAKYIPIKAQ